MKWLRIIMAMLLFGCVVLWVRSYGTNSWPIGEGYFWVIEDGYYFVGYLEPKSPSAGKHWFYPVSVIEVRHSPDMWLIHGTFWLPTLLLTVTLAFTILPLIRRYHWSQRGRCPQCGYNLKGTAHVACPECGVDVPEQDA